MDRAKGYAVFLSLAAALLWATYYIFVLALDRSAPPSAVVFYPFLFGGAAYTAWAAAAGHGRALLALWRQPMACVRTGFLVGMQVSVLAATYLTGPVDASLLSLIGDVVLTPLIVALVIGAHRAHVTSRVFSLGLVLSLAGGALTIAGGQGLTAVRGLGWAVVPAVPVSVALYFLLSARENERSPPSAVVAQSMLAAALVGALVSPALPGGFAGLGSPSPAALVLLAATGVTSFFLAPALYFHAISRAGLVIPPMLMTGIPVFTLLLSATVLRLALPWVAVLGIPVAVVGAVLTLRGERPPETVEPPGPGATSS